MDIIENKVNNKYQYIVICYFIFLICKFIFEESLPIANALFTGLYVSLGYISLFFLLREFKKGSIIPNIVLICFLSTLIIIPFSANFRLVDFVIMFNYYGISFILLIYKLNYKIFRIFAFVILGFFLFHVVKGTLPDDVFSVSRNFISVVLLIGVGLHIISSIQNDLKPNPLILILATFISIWAIGRSGIFVFMVLLVTIPILSSYKFVYKVFSVILILSIAYFAYFYFSETVFSSAFNRIEKMGADDVRETMNKEYVDVTFSSLKNVFFGTPLHDVKSLIEVEFNPHNSFIRLHVYFGFFGFLLIIILIINAFFSYFKNRNFVFVILLFVLLFRSSVDSTAFHGPLDPLIYFLIFYPLLKFKLI